MKRAIADSDEVGWMGERIVTLADRENAAVYEMLGFIREFDVCRGWARDGAASCSEWLQRFARMGEGPARERVRVAHALGTFGAIDAALHDGTLSYSKVRAIVRVATADNEAALIEKSRTRTAAELEKMASRIRREQAAPRAGTLRPIANRAGSADPKPTTARFESSPSLLPTRQRWS